MSGSPEAIQQSPTDSRGAKPRKGKRKGQRPVHRPQRTCIGCRTKIDKQELIRVIRTPEGQIEIDLTGKKNGRGAYLCTDAACWTRALSSGALAHALKVDVDADTIARLETYAQTLDATTTSPARTKEGIPK